MDFLLKLLRGLARALLAIPVAILRVVVRLLYGDLKCEQRKEAAASLLNGEALHKAPTTEELRSLARWLQQHKPHGGWLADIHAVDGFLTCVAVSPSAIGPGEWIAWMFEHGELPTSEQGMVALMARRMNQITEQCSGRPVAYRPLLETHPRLPSQGDVLDLWCQGFMTATVLRDREWEAQMRSQGTALWIGAILERARRTGHVPASQSTREVRPVEVSHLNLDRLKLAVSRAAGLRA